MKLADSLVAALFTLLGVYVLFEARRLDAAAGYGLGAGFFPFWLAAAIVLLGAVVLCQNLTKQKLPASGAEPVGKRQGWVIAALVAFVPAAAVAGFIVSFMLLVAFLLFCIEREAWWRALTVAGGAGIGFYLLFVRFLEVDLPKGVWNF
ncbi:MAG TPA: tripartite tricarboxylate transporter TctB family protein [Candidatus Acidoferrales bacterium]|nr:tripartite tricarboxylate transporter TctB family protein [Candidatus Acidoferrales bacterium]